MTYRPAGGASPARTRPKGGIGAPEREATSQKDIRPERGSIMRCSVLLATAVLVVCLPFASGASAAASSSVDQLAATVGASGVAVSGAATFVDVPVSASDATGDSSPAGGTDLKTATISAPQAGKLR